MPTDALQRAEDASFLDGKRFVGSEFSERAFQRLLEAVVPAGRSFTVRAPAWDMDRLELPLAGPDGLRYVLTVSPEGVSHKGEIPAGASAFFHDFAKALRAARAAFSAAAVKRVFMADPKLKKERFEMVWKFAGRATLSIIQDWGDPLHALRFLHPEGVARSFDWTVRIDGLYSAEVHHSEAECQMIHPESDAPINSYGYFAIPGEPEHAPKYRYLPEARRAALVPPREAPAPIPSLFTNLTESDIINGSSEKLRAGVERLLEEVRANPSVGLIQFNCCCVPRITGDDIHSILQSASERSPVPFIFKGQLAKTPFEQRMSHVEETIRREREKGAPAAAEGVSFLGYAESPSFYELSGLLARHGVATRAAMLPTVHPRLVPDLLASKALVANPGAVFQEVYERLFLGLGIPCVFPDMPYGAARSAAWFRAVLEAVGAPAADPESDPETKAFAQECRERAAAVRAEGARVGIAVMGLSEARRMASAAALGVPVIPALEEMGYGVDFFACPSPVDANGLKGGAPDSADAIRDVLFSAASDPARHSFTSGSAAADLDAWFASKPFFAVYTDASFDRRPAAHGKTPFVLGDFEPGWGGAARTARRFDSLRANDLFRKYGKLF